MQFEESSESSGGGSFASLQNESVSTPFLPFNSRKVDDASFVVAIDIVDQV